jgi:hypothetical protein
LLISVPAGLPPKVIAGYVPVAPSAFHVPQTLATSAEAVAAGAKAAVSARAAAMIRDRIRMLGFSLL